MSFSQQTWATKVPVNQQSGLPEWQDKVPIPKDDDTTVIFSDINGDYWGVKPNGTIEPIGNSNFVFSSTIQVFAFSRTANEIKTGFSIQLDVLPAPGVGKAIEVLGVSAQYIDNGAAFTTASGLFITETADTQQIATPNGFFSAPGNKFPRIPPINGSNGVQVVENKKLQFITDADSLVGNGTAKFYGTYRIINLLP